jgi:hypothetical protein
VHGFAAGPGFNPLISLDSLIKVAGFAPDLFLYIEPAGLIPRGLERAGCPTACILSDTHRDLPSRLSLSRFFDYVFLYHRNYIKYFSEHPPQSVCWLPYACDLELFKPRQLPRDIDVAFVGHSAHGRTEVLDRLANRHRMNERRYYLQHEIPEVYSRAKIVLNLPAADDLNFRTFEAMSCGALLLTRKALNGQEQLFEEGRHYVAYENDADMEAKVDHFLAHSDERDAIAAAGLAEVQQAHRLEQRLEQLLGTVASHDRSAPIRKLAPQLVDRQYAWLYEHERMLQSGVDLVREARRRGAHWAGLVPPVFRSLVRTVLR